MPWDSVTTSFAPFQPGNASSVVWAPPATKSTAPSRSAFTASSDGSSSTWASTPSSRKRPSSSAASAGKYELVTRSGVAILMGIRSRALIGGSARTPRGAHRPSS